MEVTMEKYGFIYLWYDRKRKMFYLGSHWGTIDDGYICSSNRMRDAYRRRPNDFKRRIVKTSVSRETLLDEEYKLLSKISDDELGKRYYNLRKHKWGHWSTDENRRNVVIQKAIGNKSRLGDHKTIEERKKISESLTGRKRSQESIEKQRQSLIGRKQTPESIAKRVKSNTGKKRQGNALINMQEMAKKMREIKKQKRIEE
jgi:hypothetical protein